MSAKDNTDLIAEYRRLRRLLHELTAKAETVDKRLVEIEFLLPDQYVYPEEGRNRASVLDRRPTASKKTLKSSARESGRAPCSQCA